MGGLLQGFIPHIQVNHVCLVLESSVIPRNETGTSNWVGTFLNELETCLKELEAHLASPNEEGNGQMFPHNFWTAHWRQ